METSDNRNSTENTTIGNTYHGRSDRVWGGVALLIIGSVVMARQLGVELPYWLFSFPMILIAAGIFFGAKCSFRPGGWMIPILIGGVLMLEEFIPDVELRHFIWPTILLGAGVLMIFRPRKRRDNYWTSWRNDSMTSSNNDSGEVLDMVAVFSENKRMVISKNFKGGEAVSVFGGTEIDLTQANFEGTVTLELTQVFGGAKLIVPAGWKIQSEVVSIFGALDDKRPQSTEGGANSTKVLNLIGTSVFGGVTIKSY